MKNKPEQERLIEVEPTALRVGVIMGSDSDLPIMAPAISALQKLGIPAEARIVSAHRTPDWLSEYARSAEERGIKVIIAGAGGSAHLPGMAAAFSETIPVIGVPIDSGKTGKMDSLLSIVNMPPGVPVNTMAINGAENAALAAAQILGVSDPEIRERVRNYRETLKKQVREKDETLQKIGVEMYLQNRT